MRTTILGDISLNRQVAFDQNIGRFRHLPTDTEHNESASNLSGGCSDTTHTMLHRAVKNASTPWEGPWRPIRQVCNSSEQPQAIPKSAAYPQMVDAFGISPQYARQAKGRLHKRQKQAALYVRVSTGEQNTEAQERGLKDYVQGRGWTMHKIYRDKGISGAKASRPGLDEMLKDCRRGMVDVVVVWKFDRFARSLKNLIAGLELCRALGIDFVSVTEAIDTSLPAGEMLFQMIGAVAQFERSLIAERVKSGLANARANGRVLGRPPLCTLSRKQVADLRRRRAHENLPFRELAKEFGVSLWTAHRLCAGRH